MIEIFSQVSVAGWLLGLFVLVALTQVPGILRDWYRQSRKPHRFIPGQDPPIYRDPGPGGDT
ncbi:MAG: hypothetical protein AAFQ54_11525 [Pseudomonadota bacterium]